MIREMNQGDAKRVLEIYQQGLNTRNATFETVVPVWEDWDKKYLEHSRFVYDLNGDVVGWVVLSSVSTREVYKGVCEISIYVDNNNKGKGIGSSLMEKVIESSEINGVWTLFSSVFPENVATIKLHEKFGFRVIGTREKIAQLDGKWRDTIMLERRSKIVGH
ncbi:MAG: GNAT family N-acetyltransferase [Bacteroidales bacterium]|nr:GNAT family N-acetyltransferase [Bacteroidales bacterium]